MSNAVKDKRLSDLYAAMANSEAFQHLMAWMEEERQNSVKRVDSLPASDLTVGQACEERGIRKGFQKVLNQVAFVQENL